MKCRCTHLLARHAGFGRCGAERSTPGGHVYRCNCAAFRSKEVDALLADARAEGAAQARKAMAARLEVAVDLIRAIGHDRAVRTPEVLAPGYCPCTEEYNGGMTGPPGNLKHTKGCPYARRG